MLKPDTETRPHRLEPPELEAILGAVDDRLETAAPDLVAILRRGRAELEQALAHLPTR